MKGQQQNHFFLGKEVSKPPSLFQLFVHEIDPPPIRKGPNHLPGTSGEIVPLRQTPWLDRLAKPQKKKKARANGG